MPIHCPSQQLAGAVTPEGLWLASTAPGSDAGRFGVLATAVGRVPGALVALPDTGTVEVEGGVARFVRNGLTEEYRVGLDGIRQDFLVAERPPGRGLLRLNLRMTGGEVEAPASGGQLRLVLPGGSRDLVYGRLQVTDAGGVPLPAGLFVLSRGRVAVVVDDASAAYPIRIDPTFTDANWRGMGGIPGVFGSVHALAVDNKGHLYLAGNFAVAGGVSANRIARWDGSAWSELGSGLSDAVHALVASGTDLYAGGRFTTAGGVAANRIARWDGNSWSPLGSGMDSEVYALAVSGDRLYAGGSFTSAGGSGARSVACWDGTAWSALGTGVSGRVASLVVADASLYVGGELLSAGDLPANRIAKWDGAVWSALGAGFNHPVLALAVSGTNLFAGGRFTTSGGYVVNRVAWWDGIAWSNLGMGVNGSVTALVVADGDLYVGGDFDKVFDMTGGISAPRVAKWDGQAWSALGSGLSGAEGSLRLEVSALAAYGRNVWVGGAGIGSAGGTGVMNVARWNGDEWSRAGSGLNAPVVAWAVSGSNVYAGGSFLSAGGADANHVARWDGSNWFPLGTGIDGDVRALAVMGADLYAGGNFTAAGGSRADNIAKWEGSSWSNLGAGVNGVVDALAVLDGNLYVGGQFSTAGKMPANSIARWDGSGWSVLGSGVGGLAGSAVRALAVSGSALHAGGRFTTAGGIPANHIASWNGVGWSALGDGIDGGSYTCVWELEAAGTNLYVGGDFSTAGRVSAPNIARWDGSAWSALGGGASSRVYALHSVGNDLYAGGVFTSVDGVNANHVARWDGRRWSALSSGTWGPVMALRTAGTSLYVGGNFTGAGGIVSGYAVTAEVPPTAGPPVIVEQPQSQTIEADYDVSFSVWAGGEGPQFFRWHRNGIPLGNGGRIAGADTTMLALVDLEPGDTGAYTVTVSNALGSTASSDAFLTVIAIPALDEAVEARQLSWTTGGAAPWRGQTGVSHDGADAAGSGAITKDQESWLGTTVHGPGTLSFWWKVSCQAGYSGLDLEVNGARLRRITGEVDWQQVTLDLPAGPQVLRWRYSKTWYFATGQDRGWVDEVRFIPDASPEIVNQPRDQTVLEGATVVFTVNAAGTAPLHYQWRKDGVVLSDGGAITGATAFTLRLSPVDAKDAGAYSVVVSNRLGSITSAVGLLRVTARPPPPLVVGRCHPVADTSQPEAAFSSAFDGANFLVGLRGDSRNADSVGVQLVSRAGAKVGLLTGLGRRMGGSFDGPRVACGVPDHLLVWTDAASQHPATGNDIYARRISPSGALVGENVVVTQAPGDQSARGVAPGGTDFLVIWSSASGLWGRRLSAAGQLLGDEVRFTGAEVEEAACVTAGGGRWLVTWVEGEDGAHVTRGRFLATDGVPGVVLALSERDSYHHNPVSAAFGGGRFLVVWHHNADDEADWNLRGRMVLPEGTLAGGELVLADGPGQDVAWSGNVAFDGQQFLVVWTEFEGNPATGPGTVRGRYWTMEGAPAGASFVVAPAQTGQMGTGLSEGAGGVLTLINTSAFGPDADVCVRFITRPFVSVRRPGSQAIEISYGGILQSGTDLESWQDVAPQPASPWVITADDGARLFRSRATAAP